MRTGLNLSERAAYTQIEFAQLVGVTSKSVYNARRAGRLRSIRVGNGPKSKVLIPASALREFLGEAAPQTVNA